MVVAAGAGAVSQLFRNIDRKDKLEFPLACLDSGQSIHQESQSRLKWFDIDCTLVDSASTFSSWPFTINYVYNVCVYCLSVVCRAYTVFSYRSYKIHDIFLRARGWLRFIYYTVVPVINIILKIQFNYMHSLCLSVRTVCMYILSYRGTVISISYSDLLGSCS